MKHGSDSLSSTSVGGYSEEYLDVKGYELESGRNIQYSDIVSRQKVCVIGYFVAQDVYKRQVHHYPLNPQGRITIKGE